MAASGIRSQRIRETPFAVIDFETTGLRPGGDRVVEVSVVRVEPGKPPELVLDTLVNPRRRVTATEIHGITDADVADAPAFRDIAGDFLRAISGAVVGSYNVYFDVPFMEQELADADMAGTVPHLCVMYLRPMLGLGNRCCLEDACRQHGISHPAAHMASADAQATGHLLACYLETVARKGVATFDDLARLKSYKFLSSFDLAPLSSSVTESLPRCGRLKSRASFAGSARQQESELRIDGWIRRNATYCTACIGAWRG